MKHLFLGILTHALFLSNLNANMCIPLLGPEIPIEFRAFANSGHMPEYPVILKRNGKVFIAGNWGSSLEKVVALKSHQKNGFGEEIHDMLEIGRAGEPPVPRQYVRTESAYEVRYEARDNPSDSIRLKKGQAPDKLVPMPYQATCGENRTSIEVRNLYDGSTMWVSRTDIVEMPTMFYHKLWDIPALSPRNQRD